MERLKEATLPSDPYHEASNPREDYSMSSKRCRHTLQSEATLLCRLPAVVLHHAATTLPHHRRGA